MGTNFDFIPQENAYNGHHFWNDLDLINVLDARLENYDHEFYRFDYDNYNDHDDYDFEINYANDNYANELYDDAIIDNAINNAIDNALNNAIDNAVNNAIDYAIDYDEIDEDQMN